MHSGAHDACDTVASLCCVSRYANGAGNTFVGAIDEVVTWGRSLSAAEASALVGSGVPLRVETPRDGAVLVSALLTRPSSLGRSRDFQAVKVRPGGWRLR
jgi:hypothetical protein